MNKTLQNIAWGITLVAFIIGLIGLYQRFMEGHQAANYGSYVTQESNPNYGRPSFDPNVAYQPRILQLGFRIAF